MKANGSVCQYQIADSGLLELKGLYCSNFWFELNKLKNFATFLRDTVSKQNPEDVRMSAIQREEFADPRLIIDIYYEES